MSRFWKNGDAFVWLTGSAVAVSLIMVAALLALILWNGLGFFWPKELVRFSLAGGEEVLGEITDREMIPGQAGGRIQVKRGNRDIYGADFLWIDEAKIERRESPPAAAAIERREWGVLFGVVEEVKDGGRTIARGANEAWTALRERKGRADAAAVVAVAGGGTKEVPLAQIVRACLPNRMGLAAKAGSFVEKLWEFVSDDPRESNTEGGVFPAIFGTVFMVLIMSVLVTPLGILAAFFLREYAKQGPVVSTVRIAVNNLAGVPSIVFGVFGVGFFIYFLGGNIDRLFFADALPSPTFGTGGILWASLTLALLTLPVVIVATEEGLAAIPRGMREASLALGATRFETMWRVVLPAVMPSVLTGLILAMARAAGEVAPLMITGVVKLAPALPVDGTWPFIHLDRKFMHLGFHIYDVGFQSPNVDTARPMVYMTTLLLVAIILSLNITAIVLRGRLGRRFAVSGV